MMGPIEEALREKFFFTLFGGEEIDTNIWKILGHSVKHGGLSIPDPRLSAKSAYNTSKVASGELVNSLFGGSALNYVGHRACVCRSSLAERREKMHVELGELSRQKELTGGQERNHLHRSTRNGVWLSSVPHRLNGTELFREEFRDNLRLRYWLMPQDIPATCNGCGNFFSIEQALSCPKGGLVMVRHDDNAKEWGALVARALVPSAITYEPKINSRAVQGDRTGVG